MSIGSLAIGQLSPAIKSTLERILLLPLESLKAEVLFQRNLSRVQMGLLQHPAKNRQKPFGIGLRAFEAHQNSIFVGIATQPCSAALHQIRQLDMIQRSTAATENGAEQLMSTPLPDRICTASPSDPELCG